MTIRAIIGSIKTKFQPIQKLAKVVYESPKIDEELPFAMTIAMGRSTVMLHAGNHCPHCQEPLSDRFGTRYCHNEGCPLAGLKQN
jgi:hypothetical protein